MTGGAPAPDFGQFVRKRHLAGRTVVQPRMGFGDPAAMRAGLVATRSARASTVGTITLDSYTRLADPESARRSLAAGIDLNGYPICTHDVDVTRHVLDGVQSPDFAVQVRHGSAVPHEIVESSLAAGLTATEGGPVSYCLPYGRIPLGQSVRNWAEASERLAAAGTGGARPHVESFGGCLLGQLCPPGLLVAVAVLEALFFRQHGLRSISVSYAQQPDPQQNREALAALRALCSRLLPDVDWHVVVYAYMGVYPATASGSYRILQEAAQLTADSGSERLIVKTVAESVRIPTVAENIDALEFAGAVVSQGPTSPMTPADNAVHAEATALVEAVLELGDDVGDALLAAFAAGVLDVPWCLHPDNRGEARSHLDGSGRILWSRSGRMPLTGTGPRDTDAGGSAALLRALSFVQRTRDEGADAPLDLAGAGFGRRTR